MSCICFSLISGHLQPQIRHQPLHSTLAAKPSLFITTERACRVKFVVSISPNDAGAEFTYHLEDLATFVGPNAGAETIGNIVRALESFFWRAERHNAQNRPKNFLLRNPVCHGHTGQKGGRKPVTALWQRAS